jgi:hypothetical protein
MHTSAGRANQDGPVVHIGYGKCASTFLQEAIFPQLSQWTYFNRIVPERFDFWRRLRTKTFDGGDADLTTLVASTWRPGVVFSREHLLQEWCVPGSLGLSNLRHLGNMFGAEPTILVILRRQDDWVHSMFKFKHTKFRKPANVLKRYTPRFLDYAALDDRLNELGFTKIVYYPYERLFGTEAGCQHFASSVFGTSLSADIDLSRRVNESPRVAMMGYQYEVMQFLANRVPGFAGFLPASAIELSPPEREDILGPYRASNERFSRKNELGLDQYGYF